MLSLSSLFSRGGNAAAPVAVPAAANPASGLGFAADREVRSSLELRRDRTSSMLVWLFVLLGVVIVAGMWFGTFAKQETMRGYVTAATGAVRISTEFAGTVAKVHVAQGDMVEKGQRLLTLVQEQAATDTGPLMESRIASMEDQRSNMQAEIARLDGLMKRDPQDRASFEADFEKLKATLAAEEKSVAAALASQEKQVRKIEGFVQQGYATRETLAAQQRLAIDYSRQLAELRLRSTELLTQQTDRRRQLDQSMTEAGNRRTELMNSVREIDAQLQLVKSQGELDIIAPSSGRLATLAAREGAPVERGQFVAALADPEAPVRIVLEAPARSIGLVNVGDRVVLKYDSFPFKTFGVRHGTVSAISEAALSIPREMQSPDPRKPAESTFLVEVIPETTTIDAYGEERPILIGSTLSADVVVERRRIIQWVLDPILAVRGRL